MNKSQRIYFSTGDTGNENQDKYIKVRLEQDTETLEFMSLSLGTADVYQNFNSDYGVLVGRVIANGGIGIPNAKISIFIPIDDEDAQDPEIYSFYPYKTPRDKNVDGKRYNLLPRVSEVDPNTGQLKPKQAFGSFPIKEEIVGNQPFLEVYKKYYKYTALTNNAGDYMMFGVPVGTQTVHLSVDITDIGEYSMTPASMVTNLGYSPNQFTDNQSIIKPSKDLNDLPNIETQEISVDVRPFWGDAENFEIGITRQDFRIRSVLVNTFVLFGSVFTDGNDTMWSAQWTSQERISEYFRASHPSQALHGISNKRIGPITEKIYYYPADISDDDIDSGNVADDGSDMLVLDPSEYSVYKRDGDFVVIVSCNRNKVVTDESGNKISVSNDSFEGIFTKFRGFMTLELSDEYAPLDYTTNVGEDVNIRPYRYKLKFPQYANKNAAFEAADKSTGDDTTNTNNWRKQHKTFEGGKYYSVARFHGLNFNNYQGNDNDQKFTDGFFAKTSFNSLNVDRNNNVGIIVTEDQDDFNNEDFQFPSNGTDGTFDVFGAAWLNLTVHLPQAGYAYEQYNKMDYTRTNDSLSRQYIRGSNNNGLDLKKYRNRYYITDNQQKIAAGQFNTKFFARSDVHWTDIIEVPVEDITEMNKITSKGFTELDPSNPLNGTEYRNGEYVPSDWTVTTAVPLNADEDPRKYFYKGWGSADCIAFLEDLGII
jgi:hypothetical protein